MGTFHQDRGELHGITVVVETDASEVWVGRCDTADDRGVVLRDADVHRESSGRDAFLRSASELGVWPRHRQVLIPSQSVASIRRLGEL
ncbi:MAG: hypothetical protein ABI609_09620 [Acidobacteriota bacterium]